MSHGYRPELPLETWSCTERGTKGKDLLQGRKITRYVLWLYPTGRWVLLPFPHPRQRYSANAATSGQGGTESRARKLKASGNRTIRNAFSCLSKSSKMPSAGISTNSDFVWFRISNFSMNSSSSLLKSVRESFDETHRTIRAAALVGVVRQLLTERPAVAADAFRSKIPFGGCAAQDSEHIAPQLLYQLDATWRLLRSDRQNRDRWIESLEVALTRFPQETLEYVHTQTSRGLHPARRFALLTLARSHATRDRLLDAIDAEIRRVTDDGGSIGES